MRRRWAVGVAAGVIVVGVAAGAAGYAIGGRTRSTGAAPSTDPPRLQVAAWVQEWAEPSPGVGDEIFTAPAGAGDVCSAAAPCSLATAQHVARSLSATATSDVVVSLAGGVYEMHEPLLLGPEDSGRNGHRVTYRASRGETPVLSGGRSISGWRPSEGKPGVFQADVPIGTAARQLYVNDVRATRARGPEHPAGWTRTAEGFRAPDEQMAGWPDAGDAEIVSVAEWRAFRCRVGSVRGADVAMVAPCWRNATAPDRFPMNEVTWVENALELLDEPGEWYLDPRAGHVFYRPRPGEDLAQASATLAMTQSLLEVRGNGEGPVHDVGVDGLTFAYAGWSGPSGDAGYAATQAGWHRGADAGPDALDIERTPGAVTIGDAHHVRITGATFEHLGGVGLDVIAGAQDVGIVGNGFRDISSTAIQMGEARQGAQNPPAAEQVDRLQVANNLIDHAAVEYLDGVGIFASYVSNASLQHNELTHLPYTGISLGWGWGTDSYARNNLVGANRITDVVTTLHDGGAIYTLSPMPGTVIERNHITDQHNAHGAIYLDEGTAFVTVADNVVERVPRWLHIWTASIHDNTIVDNSTDTTEMLDAGTRNAIARTTPHRSEWTASTQQIIDEAGLEPAYALLRDHR